MISIKFSPHYIRLLSVTALKLDVVTLKSFLFSFSALNIVYQRNGDGEAKSPACRAGVCEAVLHTLEQGTRFSA